MEDQLFCKRMAKFWSPLPVLTAAEFALSRYNGNGTLDTSFSDDGKATTGFASLDNIANAAAIQADGKILVAGKRDIGWASNGNGILVLSFNSNATQARVNEALSSLAYRNTASQPPVSVTIDWAFSDGNPGTQGSGGAKSVIGSVKVGVIDNSAINSLQDSLGQDFDADGQAAGFSVLLSGVSSLNTTDFVM